MIPPKFHRAVVYVETEAVFRESLWDVSPGRPPLLDFEVEEDEDLDGEAEGGEDRDP